MTTKVYAFLGRNSASLDFPVAQNGSVKIDFTGGNIYDTKAYAPARTRPISDPAVQAVIENSAYFGKQVILYDSTEHESEDVATKVKEYPDVTNFAEACAVLKSEYGVKAQQLRSPAGVRNLASSLFVAFPNWAE